jgi:hypothetical protein
MRQGMAPEQREQHQDDAGADCGRGQDNKGNFNAAHHAPGAGIARRLIS